MDSFSRRILLVEDDQFIRELYEEVLTEAGFVVSSVSNGEEALKSISSLGPYDIILLDIMMPKQDGISFLKELKKTPHQQYRQSMIILLTNLAHDPVIKEALSLGVKDYFIKSDITPRQLVSKLQNYFS